MSVLDPRLYRLPNIAFTLLRPGKVMPVNTAMFRVPLDVNKPQIANYLEQLYGMKIKKVNTAIYLGKMKRSPVDAKSIKKKDWKKAIVTFEPAEGEADWSYPDPDTVDTIAKWPQGEGTHPKESS